MGDDAVVQFNILGIDEAGNYLTELKDSTVKLKYSTIARSTSTYSIYARIEPTPLTTHFALSVEASSFSSGEGNLGQSLGSVQLSTSWKPVISEIGSCYTGSDPNAGRVMVYDLQATSASAIHSNGNQGFSVWYTIAD